MADRFEDERGVIQDILGGPIDAVTEIITHEGAVRGNHVHNHSTQWIYMVSGRMLTAAQHPDVPVVVTTERAAGDFFCEPPGIPHAWKALEETRLLVFAIGPRAGENYENDTVRLEVPLL